MAMRLVVSPAAIKELAVVSRRERDALLVKAESFASEPVGRHPWATPSRGFADRIRIRQGDLRAVLLILRDCDTVVLERVAHRREVYR